MRSPSELSLGFMQTVGDGNPGLLYVGGGGTEIMVMRKWKGRNMMGFLVHSLTILLEHQGLWAGSLEGRSSDPIVTYCPAKDFSLHP